MRKSKAIMYKPDSRRKEYEDCGMTKYTIIHCSVGKSAILWSKVYKKLSYCCDSRSYCVQWYDRL